MKVSRINIIFVILYIISTYNLLANPIEPKGGYNHDFWVIGDTVTISWDIVEFNESNGPISIELWNGNTYSNYLLADNIEPDSKYFKWLIPSDFEPGDQYRIILSQNSLNICNNNFIMIFLHYPFNRNIITDEIDYSKYSSGVDLDLTIFPNPATDVIFVTSSNTISGILRISDIRGEIYLNQSCSFPSKNFQLDINTLPIGSYYLQLLTEESLTKSYLFNVVR